LRWRIAILISAAIAISYLDRQTLPVAIKAIGKDIPLTNSQFSALQSAFLFSYALMYAGGGRLVDFLGTSRAFLAIMIFWSLACASHALALSFAMLAASRFLLGMEKAVVSRRPRARFQSGFRPESVRPRWGSSTPARPWEQSLRHH
jgi:ACS family hexuronate transporter-like MFS transporter